jgi:hypothetical protein
MLSELIARIREVFEPYTFEDFIKDSKPQSVEELQYLENIWNRTTDDFKKMY